MNSLSSHNRASIATKKPQLLFEVVLQLQLGLLVNMSLIDDNIFYLADNLSELLWIRLNLHVLHNSLTEVVTDLLQNACVEMQVSVLAEITAAKGCFEGE